LCRFNGRKISTRSYADLSFFLHNPAGARYTCCFVDSSLCRGEANSPELRSTMTKVPALLLSRSLLKGQPACFLRFAFRFLNRRTIRPERGVPSRTERIGPRSPGTGFFDGDETRNRGFQIFQVPKYLCLNHHQSAFLTTPADANNSRNTPGASPCVITGLYKPAPLIATIAQKKFGSTPSRLRNLIIYWDGRIIDGAQYPSPEESGGGGVRRHGRT